jgi:hypothetical protein
VISSSAKRYLGRRDGTINDAEIAFARQVTSED